MISRKRSVHFRIISYCTPDSACADHYVHPLTIEKTALDRGRTDRISLTHDLDLDL